MENDYMTFPFNKDMDVRSKTYEALISYMESCNEFWYIKDKDSRFIYMNNYGLHYSGLPKGFDVEGKLDSECPVYWSEISDVIQRNDKNVMESQRVIPTLISFRFGGREKQIQPFMADVSPLIKNGESIGVIGRAKKTGNLFNVPSGKQYASRFPVIW